MANTKDQFTKAEGVGRMNITLDDLVVHQPVDDVGALPIRRAKDRGVPQQVALVPEGVDAHAFSLAEVLIRVVGVQGIDAPLEFLAVARGMQTIGGATREVGQFQAASELQDAIVGREPPDKLDKLESICGCSIERFFSTLTQLFLCTLSGYAPAGGAVKDCPGVYQ